MRVSSSPSSNEADFAKMKVHADADAYFKPKFEAAKGLSVEAAALGCRDCS